MLGFGQAYCFFLPFCPFLSVLILVPLSATPRDLVSPICRIFRLILSYQQELDYFKNFPRYLIRPSSLKRPGCLLSKQICQHALAPSVGRILSFALSLLAFRQIFFVCGSNLFLVFLISGLGSSQG